MRISILLLVSIVVIHSFSLNLLKQRSDQEYRISRYDRAAKGKVDPKIANEVVSKHMKLARVFNALYLQMELADENIGYRDIIAGIWNLKDKSVLDELVSMNIDGFSGQLKELSKSIDAVPDGMTQIADVEEIREKYKVIEGITDQMRNDLINSSDTENIPNVITKKGIAIKDLKHLEDLSENLAEKVVKKLVEAENTNTIEKKFGNDLATLMNDCQIILASLPDIIGSLMKDTGKTLDALLKGMQVATTIYRSTTNFKQLSDLLKSTENGIMKVQTLKDPSLVIRTKQAINPVLTTLQEIHQPSKKLSIGSAFLSNHDLSQIYHDLQDKWLKEVLNDGNNLKQLDTFLENFKKFTMRFAQLEKNSGSIFEKEHPINLRHMSDFLEGAENFQTLSIEHELPGFISCLNISDMPEPASLAEMQILSMNLNKFFRVMPTIQQALNKVTDANETAKKIDEYSMVAFRLRDFDTWKTSPAFQEWKTFFTDLSTGLFASLKQNQTFTGVVKNLTGAGSTLKKVQNWISQIKLARNECDSVFNYDIGKLEEINKFPNSISQLKSGKYIPKVQNLLDTFQKVKTGLKALDASALPSVVTSRSTTKSPRGKRATSEIKDLNLDSETRMYLLETAFAVYSLEKMTRIAELDTELGALISNGDSVVAAIRGMKNQGKKQELEDIWKNWPGLKLKLQTFKANNVKAIGLIQSKNEKSLREIGRVYLSFSHIPFSGKFQLTKFKESLKFLEKPIPDVENALEKLEKPIEMDWELVHTNFKRVPNALGMLQKDFATFFSEEREKEVKKPSVLDIFKDNSFYYFFCAPVGGILLIVGIASLIYYFVFIFDPDMWKTPYEEPEYKIPETDEWTFMQMQDARRLELNSREKGTNNTPIYDAVIRKDWAKVDWYLNNGAILDATCSGKLHRTCIYELILMNNVEYVKKFLKAGAEQDVHNSKGESDDWALRTSDEMWTLILSNWKYRERNNMVKPNRVVPGDCRPWNVLVFDRNCFPRRWRKRLPFRIKHVITWGYKKGMDLNKFTHIVVPDKYVKDNNTLLLDDDDLMPYRWMGVWGCIVGTRWLKALIDKKIGETAMDNDYEYYLLHTFYHGNKNEKAIYTLKTRHHRLLPRLLTHAVITILETGDKKKAKQKEEWIEIIKLFGGEISNDPNTVDYSPRPYYSMSGEWQNSRWRQNRCWILKYPDSKIDPEWASDKHLYTLVDFHFLNECLARGDLLPDKNEVVKLVGPTSAEMDAKEKEEEEKEKKEKETKMKKAAKHGKASSTDTKSSTQSTTKSTTQSSVASKK